MKRYFLLCNKLYTYIHNILYIKETTCVCINEQWVEITSLKLNQLKEQLKLRNIKCEGNKDKLVITLKEVYI